MKSSLAVEEWKRQQLAKAGPLSQEQQATLRRVLLTTPKAAPLDRPKTGAGRRSAPG